MSDSKGIRIVGGIAAALVLVAWNPRTVQAQSPEPARAASPAWDARTAEHLWNRAAFGARPAAVESAAGMDRAAFVDQLLAGFAPTYDAFFVEAPDRPARGEMAALDTTERKEIQQRLRREDREQMFRFAGWWIDQMLSDGHPLRERMVLFWHGYFTSSWRDVKSSSAMIRQNELFRTQGMGHFGDLLRAIVRDPAMLEYLDNNQNRKGNPNENFAREIMELFTLGVGNYGEKDVQEAARALTGWQTRDGRAFFNRRQHDAGPKTILGVSRDFDADAFVALLLEQEACQRWLARKLLVHFEGREPDAARLADYARFLKSNEYDIAAFLRRLFLDPAFYADAVVANRIAGPVEYLVGCSRRLGIRPPPVLLWIAAGQLGQKLFEPPNVKGWEGGQSWITTSTLMQRGNMAGMLLGVVKLEDVVRPEADEVEPESEDGAMTEAMDSTGGRDGASETAPGPRRAAGGKAGGKPGLGPDGSAMRRLLGDGYRPGINLCARCRRAEAATDAQIVDALAAELLPIALTPESRAALCGFLASERARRELADGKLLDDPALAEDVLRRLAHLVLSLPEAQLS